MYLANYGKSYALIIGIDDYQHAGPLRYAVSNATAVADLLTTTLGFETANVTILTNREATGFGILRAFSKLTRYGTDGDDRVIVFFAGHGHTETSIRGEVGFLVPSDGNPHDLSTLIRWDELTRNSDLIRAKHILFIMDACYGGLAVTRAFSPGAMRFLRDMMQRISRQVLTAGKADELVSDLGGPLPNHSVFTGHLLEALAGKAKDNDGNLTANGVIAYVYQAVGADASAQQTPHYGYLHGDGDLVFQPLQVEEAVPAGIPIEDRLVSVPAILRGKENIEVDELQSLKELLSEPKHRIQLHDFVAQRTREVLSKTAQDYFSTQGAVDKDTFVERLHRYEETVQELIPQEMLLGRWGDAHHAEAFRMPLKKLSERISPASGSTYLIESRWYPIFLLMYAGGIGAIAGNAYGNLFSFLHTPVPNPFGNKNGNVLLVAVTKPMTDIYDTFKWFPEHERNYTPRSEYLFRFFQPFADDTLFLGAEYESIFDRFELLYALEYANMDHPEGMTENESVWGPIGRFGWKGRFDKTPLQSLFDEATKEGNDWAPLRAGFFNRSLSRFQELANALGRRTSSLGWH